MVSGVQGFKRRIQAVPAELIEVIKPTLEKYAIRIVANMKRLVPVKFGDLRDSINWTWGDTPEGSVVLGSVRGGNRTEISITIYAGNASTMVTNSRGVAFQNALIQEFGKNASPYFYPSWRANRQAAKSAQTRTIRKAIKKMKSL